MAIDLRKLKPTECQRLVNSTSLGTVLTEKRLRRIRDENGYWISDDGKTINLFKLAGLLVHELKNPVVEQTYEEKKEAARLKSRSVVKAGQDIGEIPKVNNPKRRKAAEKCLVKFLGWYFPETFYLKWSNDHKRIIPLIQDIVLNSGLKAFAMPRGYGKTAITEGTCIYALLYGLHKYVALIGATEVAALEMLESIQMELEHNDLLLEDFPEVCYPIRCLEGIPQRRLRYQGEIIHMEFTAHKLVLPTIPGSKASGSIVNVTGIGGRIRGLKFKGPDLVTIRPSLVIADDPQTDESAKNPTTCAYLEEKLSGTVLGLEGPGKKLSVIMPCTVINEGDLSERMLNRKTHPQWHGERTKMVYEWPTNTNLWDEYTQIWEEELRADRGPKKQNSFFRKHRKAMEEGSIVAWPARKDGALSAMQCAYNKRLDMGDAGFFAEYQNDPLPKIAEDSGILTAVQISQKTNGFKHIEIPYQCNTLTMFIDVMQDALYYAVCAWEEDFTGYVIDYGAFPEQHRVYFSYADVKKTLGLQFSGKGVEGAIFAGLQSLTDTYLGQQWIRDDGAVVRIDRCLVDQGFETTTVQLFCRQSKFPNVMPARGVGVGARHKPFSEYPKKSGERNGHFWRVPRIAATKSIRRVDTDVNYWKSFIHKRLLVALGDPGCLSLFAGTAERHRMISEHLAAEHRVRTEGLGRSVDEWSLIPNQDNHLLDCIVGCAVGASMEGVALPNVVLEKKLIRRTKSERVSLAEMRRRKREHV